jgi:hypothetical protein
VTCHRALTEQQAEKLADVFDAGTPSRMNGTTSSSHAHSAFGNNSHTAAAAAASGGPHFTPAMIEQLCAEHEEVRNR